MSLDDIMLSYMPCLFVNLQVSRLCLQLNFKSGSLRSVTETLYLDLDYTRAPMTHLLGNGLARTAFQGALHLRTPAVLWCTSCWGSALHTDTRLPLVRLGALGRRASLRGHRCLLPVCASGLRIPPRAFPSVRGSRFPSPTRSPSNLLHCALPL